MCIPRIAKVYMFYAGSSTNGNTHWPEVVVGGLVDFSLLSLKIIQLISHRRPIPAHGPKRHNTVHSSWIKYFLD